MQPASLTLNPRARDLIRGLYAITPDEADTGVLLNAVEQTLGAGTRLLQYRNKRASRALRRTQLQALKTLCDRHGCILVVNDEWQLAIELRLDAVHIGAEDGDAAAVRAAVGPGIILGVSCYASLDRAAQVAPYADYLAFGSVFPSTTKPGARSAALDLLRKARALQRPIVAIGGINPSNAWQVLRSGADAIAVIDGVFGADSISESTLAFLEIIKDWEEAGR